MTNKEFQELIDNQPVFALSCVSASISKLNEENFDLQDRIDKAINYIAQHTNRLVEYLDVFEAQDLVNILQGVDKE